MPTKILILKGSPREKGNSATLAEQLAAGAREAGAQVESVYLHALDLRPCDGCDECRGTGGICIIKDDMQPLYPKVAAADVLVFASPVYWFTISAQLKTCIDRWYSFGASDWQEFHGKQAAILLTYGDSDLYTSGGINAINTFETMFRFLEMKIAGMVYGTANDVGDVQKQPELMEKAYKLGQQLAQSKS
jgi:multimeric flavodoxin WrbA